MRQQIPPASRLSRRRFTKRAVVSASLTALCAAASAPGAAQAATPPALNCSAHALPVAIADPGSSDETIWGQLCYRGPQEPGTVQVLIPPLSRGTTRRTRI
jgi:hypothetical protein